MTMCHFLHESLRGTYKRRHSIDRFGHSLLWISNEGELVRLNFKSQLGIWSDRMMFHSISWRISVVNVWCLRSWNFVLRYFYLFLVSFRYIYSTILGRTDQTKGDWKKCVHLLFFNYFLLSGQDHFSQRQKVVGVHLNWMGIKTFNIREAELRWVKGGKFVCKRKQKQ